MIRRRLIAATPLLLLLSRTQAADPTPKETTWEDLMPKDWDPLKDLRLGDVGLVAEGSAKERNMMRQMREIWDNAPTNPKMDSAFDSQKRRIGHAMRREACIRLRRRR